MLIVSLPRDNVEGPRPYGVGLRPKVRLGTALSPEELGYVLKTKLKLSVINFTDDDEVGL